MDFTGDIDDVITVLQGMSDEVERMQREILDLRARALPVGREELDAAHGAKDEAVRVAERALAALKTYEQADTRLHGGVQTDMDAESQMANDGVDREALGRAGMDEI